MAWVAVDKDGTEKIFNERPFRRSEHDSLSINFWSKFTTPFIRKAYTKNDYHKWAAYWSSDSNNPAPEGSVKLPKGTIKRLIGKTLTWNDEPVELVKEK